MNLAQLRDYTRGSVLRDAHYPRAWTDQEINTWLNDAEAAIARATGVYYDTQSDFLTLTTVSGTAVYTLDSRVLTVRRMIGPTGCVMQKLSANAHFVSTGMPRAWSQQTPHSVTLLPTPDAAYTIQLYATRLPLVTMEADSDAPELPAHYHLALCDWAGFRALTNHDALDDSKGLAAIIRERWARAVLEIKRDVHQLQFGT